MAELDVRLAVGGDGPLGAGQGQAVALVGVIDAVLDSPAGAPGERDDGPQRERHRRPAHALPIRRGPCRVASRQLFQDLAERYPTRAEQHEGVEPQVGDFLDDTPVALTTERRGDHLGRLFTDLPAHVRLARRQQTGDVRSRGLRRLSLLDDALDAFEHGRWSRARIVAGAALERGEKARTLPGVAGHAFLVHLHQERVAVTIGVDRLDVLDVPRRLALPPRLAARARPEVG